ncbi:MAG TPA: hypothetical protein VGR71_16680 [Nitrospira sp.]|nr:hypothetical protein [Nitrospira sp.]
MRKLRGIVRVTHTKWGTRVTAEFDGKAVRVYHVRYEIGSVQPGQDPRKFGPQLWVNGTLARNSQLFVNDVLVIDSREAVAYVDQ